MMLGQACGALCLVLGCAGAPAGGQETPRPPAHSAPLNTDIPDPSPWTIDELERIRADLEQRSKLAPQVSHYRVELMITYCHLIASYAEKGEWHLEHMRKAKALATEVAETRAIAARPVGLAVLAMDRACGRLNRTEDRAFWARIYVECFRGEGVCHVSALQKLRRLYHLLGKTEEEEATLRVLIATDTPPLRSYVRLVQMLAVQQRFDEAVSVVEQAQAKGERMRATAHLKHKGERLLVRSNDGSADLRAVPPEDTVRILVPVSDVKQIDVLKQEGYVDLTQHAREKEREGAELWLEVVEEMRSAVNEVMTGIGPTTCPARD